MWENYIGGSMNLKRLKDLREDNDLTHKKLAEILKCNANTYSSWENGYALIPLSYLDELSIYYKVSFSYIIGNTKAHKYSEEIGKMNQQILWANMKKERKNRNLTQEDVANILHIAKTTYHDYEHGKYAIKLDKLIELVNYYKVDIDVFCGKIK